jgi:FkbM family methyltransferase
MPGARTWLGKLLLHAPAPLRSFRNAPVLGKLIHGLSYRILPANEMVWAQIEAGPAQGLWIELNPRTGRTLLRGEGETAVQKALAERLRPGMIFYDLGANIGLYSLLAARMIGATGRVFSFEPDAYVAGRLHRNIAQNGFQNVTVVESAVWSTSGDFKFVAADSSSPDHGTGRVVSEEDASRGTSLRCVSLDDFTANAPPPDAIKCDVEGAEVEVFHGAEKMLRARHPWILCEMHSNENDRAAREFLGCLGYTFERIDGNHVLAFAK